MVKVSLDISRKEELSETVRSFPVFYDKSHKGFKEKNAIKNACDGVATAFEFIKTPNYFYFNSFIPFFETVFRCSQFILSVSFISVFHYAEAIVRRCFSK